MQPVTNDAACGAARYTAAPTSSQASPNRFIGVWFRIWLVRSSVSSLRFCSAGKNPGRIAFTLTLYGAHSRARKCVIWLTPPLATEYVNTFESGGFDEADEILMTLPPR